MTVLSFHSDPKLKAKIVRQVKRHSKLDEIIKGQFYKNGKGCRVGCVVHTRYSPHAKEAEMLGYGEWLPHLCDTLFENLPNEHAKKFVVDSISAIPVGVYLEPVKWKFAVFLLKENAKRVEGLLINDNLKKKVLDAISLCKSVNENAIAIRVWNEEAAAAARSTARSAAVDAQKAAASISICTTWVATRSAAAAAESAARVTGETAWAAVRTAVRTEAVAVRTAAYIRYAEKLILLLKEAV